MWDHPNMSWHARLHIEPAIRLMRDEEYASKVDAYAQAIRALVARSKPSFWMRLSPWHAQRIDRKYIHEFADLGSLDGVLECCKSLGVNPDEVRAIHALIFG